MSDAAGPDDHPPIGGWVLRADPAVFDVGPMIEEFGQVFRYPLPPSSRAEMMDAGQPCFLYSSDTSKVVGIAAVGEVVAPTFSAPIDVDDPGAGDQLFAEVELLPLEKVIPMTKLSAHKVLARSELVTAPDAPNPILLSSDEVRAIEEFESFLFVEPTEDQLARLSEVLGPDDQDLIFQLVGSERSFGIMDDGADDELLSVFTVSPEGTFELGRFQEFSDAVDLVRLRAQDLELDPPVTVTDNLPDGDPVAILQTDDGMFGVYRVAESTFDLYDATEDGDLEPMARFESLDDALMGLIESVEEYDDEDGEGADDRDEIEVIDDIVVIDDPDEPEA